jgi:hypothetical protein
VLSDRVKQLTQQGSELVNHCGLISNAFHDLCRLWFSVLHQPPKAIKQNSSLYCLFFLCSEYFLHQPPNTIKPKSYLYFLLFLCVLNIFFCYFVFRLPNISVCADSQLMMSHPINIFIALQNCKLWYFTCNLYTPYPSERNCVIGQAS